MYPESIRSIDPCPDPDPDSEPGSGSRRAKINYGTKIEKN
jgi:hypothetical protein